MYFFDWDGGSYWDAKNLFLFEQLNTSLELDCSKVSTDGSRLVSSARPSQTVELLGGEWKLRVDSSGIWVDDGYRSRHRDAGLVGSVELSFDAGFHFETEDRAAFRWRADYSDDVKHLETEGGELWFERAPFECR